MIVKVGSEGLRLRLKFKDLGIQARLILERFD